MNFKDFRVIEEALNKTLKWKWKRQESDEYHAQFTTPSGRSMEVLIEKIGNSWELMFAPENPPDSDRPIGLTGENEPLPILATVIDIAKAFVEQKGGIENVRKIQFSADKEDKTRASAYKRIAERMIPKDWKLDVDESDRAFMFTITHK